MHDAAPRRIALVALTLAALAAAAAAPAPPQTMPAPTTAPATAPAVKVGDQVVIDDLIDLFAERTGAMVIRTKPLQDRVQLTDDFPADPAQALRVLNDMLAPANLTAYRTKTLADRFVLRVMSAAEARERALAEGPVTAGVDPRQIDLTDKARMVTHIVPLLHGELMAAARRAAGEEKEVTVTVAGAADTQFQLIITGPAAAVRRAVEFVVALDKPAVGKSITRAVHLKTADAAAAAVAVDRAYGSTLGENALRVEVDRRSNTVVLQGPEPTVFQALGTLEWIDMQPPPRVEFKIPPRTPSLPMNPAAPPAPPAPRQGSQRPSNDAPRPAGREPVPSSGIASHRRPRAPSAATAPPRAPAELFHAPTRPQVLDAAASHGDNAVSLIFGGRATPGRAAPPAAPRGGEIAGRENGEILAT
jgi:hypothetical protein